MAEIVDIITKKPTVEAIYKKYEENKGDPFRNHLGASLIGRQCERQLWYSFRWCTKPKFNGRMLRLFQTGFREESRLIKDLRDCGITVYDRDPDSGKQIHYTSFGGHFAGSLDGVSQGFEEAPVSWHVLEVKTTNTKSFKVLQSSGVKIAKPEHFYQMQTYMGWAGLERAYYFAVCKETDEIYGERVYFDKDIFDQIEDKANRIVFADSPLSKTTLNTDSFECRYCDHKEICHNGRLPEVNCRTCSYSDPIYEGKWKCCKCNLEIEPIQQRKALPCHIFIPGLVPLQQIDADPDAGTITYECGIVNGPGCVLSVDLQGAIDVKTS